MLYKKKMEPVDYKCSLVYTLYLYVSLSAALILNKQLYYISTVEWMSLAILNNSSISE